MINHIFGIMIYFNSFECNLFIVFAIDFVDEQILFDGQMKIMEPSIQDDLMTIAINHTLSIYLGYYSSFKLNRICFSVLHSMQSLIYLFHALFEP